MRLFYIFIIIASLFFSGCSAITSLFKSNDVRIANPNNVYRFAENTELKVFVQNPKDGTWYELSYKVLVPVGYYIGSGIEDE